MYTHISAYEVELGLFVVQLGVLFIGRALAARKFDLHYED